MKDIHVTEEGVLNLLLKLNPAKACGPDSIPARILKELAHEIAPYLVSIFQRSLDTGKVPKDWRMVNVTAIFKKGEKYKPSNYRPVSLTCNCSMFCCTLLYVHFSIAIILMGKRELIALLHLSSWCLVMVERLFLTVPRGCLQFVIVVFPDHTHLLFLYMLQDSRAYHHQ